MARQAKRSRSAAAVVISTGHGICRRGNQTSSVGNVLLRFGSADVASARCLACRQVTSLTADLSCRLFVVLRAVLLVSLCCILFTQTPQLRQLGLDCDRKSGVWYIW